GLLQDDQERLPALRRPATRVVRRRLRLQGSRWELLGAPALATRATEPRLQAVEAGAVGLGTARLALERAARAAAGLAGLVVGRALPPDPRPPHLGRQPGVRFRLELGRCAPRLVWPQHLPRPVRVAVRAGVVSRDLVPRADPARRLVLLVRPAPAVSRV